MYEKEGSKLDHDAFLSHDESITKDSPLTGMEIKGRKSTTPHSSNLPNHRVKIANGGWLFYELSSPRDIQIPKARFFLLFFFCLFFFSFFRPRSSTRPRKQKPTKILPITSLWRYCKTFVFFPARGGKKRFPQKSCVCVCVCLSGKTWMGKNRCYEKRSESCVVTFFRRGNFRLRSYAWNSLRCFYAIL